MTVHLDKHNQLLTVAQWTQLHSWPPEGGLRHLIFNADKNGFKKVICRIGRRVLINEKAFFEWAQEGGK